MKTPKDKYLNDPRYHELVNMLEQLIERAEFTPSELREACVLASINYEMRHVRQKLIPQRVCDALHVLEEFTNKPRNKRR